MPTYSAAVPCPQNCKAEVQPANLDAHIQWHADLQASLKAANPLISLGVVLKL